MEYSIVLKRLDDEPRFINFSNTGLLKKTLINIYNEVWNIIFDETSDKKFAYSVFFKSFKSIRLIRQFHKATHNKKLINSYHNFHYVFSLIKSLLVIFNYWTKQESRVIYILKLNTNILLEAKQIILNNYDVIFEGIHNE